MKKFFLFFKCQHQKKKKEIWEKRFNSCVWHVHIHTNRANWRETDTDRIGGLFSWLLLAHSICCYFNNSDWNEHYTHTHIYIRLFRPFNLLARGTRQMNQAKESNQTYAHTFGRWVMIRRRPLVKSIIVIILLWTWFETCLVSWPISWTSSSQIVEIEKPPPPLRWGIIIIIIAVVAKVPHRALMPLEPIGKSLG